MKEMLLQSNQPGALTDKLNENEKLVKEMSLTWEEKLQQTEQKQEDRRQAELQRRFFEDFGSSL